MVSVEKEIYGEPLEVGRTIKLTQNITTKFNARTLLLAANIACGRFRTELREERKIGTSSCSLHNYNLRASLAVSSTKSKVEGRNFWYHHTVSSYERPAC